MSRATEAVEPVREASRVTSGRSFPPAGHQPSRGRASVFSDTPGGLGGNEYCAAVLAAAAAARYDRVDLWHRWPGATREDWARVLGVDLPANVDVRPLVESVRALWPFDRGSAESGRRWLAPLHWRRDLTAGYEVAVMVGHEPPPYCRAQRGAFYNNFPFYDPQQAWPFSDSTGGVRAGLRREIARQYWKRRFATYRAGWGNSRFTSSWIQARWGVATDVLHPPSRPLSAGSTPKQPGSIVSIGRFSRRGVDKRSTDLINAFAATGLERDGARLTILGGLANDEGDLSYFGEARAAAVGHAVDLLDNASDATVRAHLHGGLIYWHAAGLDVDVTRYPERVEHFGLAVVEAMQAGCVPIVIGVGGPAEIVEDGVSGFHCTSTEEMAARTRWLLQNPGTLGEFSARARSRGAEFNRERFASTVLDAVS